MEHDGQPEEAAWPYLPQLPNDLRTYQPPAIAGPIYRRKAELLSGTVMDKIVDTLTASRPLMLIFRSSLNFLRASAHVPVEWSASDILLNLHAVVAVGHATHRKARLVRVRNSWGASWADSGHAWLHEEYVEKTFVDLVGMV
jgi:C1A family cysteine protease